MQDRGFYELCLLLWLKLLYSSSLIIIIAQHLIKVTVKSKTVPSCNVIYHHDKISPIVPIVPIVPDIKFRRFTHLFSTGPQTFEGITTVFTLVPQSRVLYLKRAIMLHSRIIVSRLSPVLRRTAQPLLHQHIGVAFSTKAPCMIDGVYSELTAMRTQIPFVEALKKKQAQEASDAGNSSTPSATTQPELRPKTMSESFHRVVSTKQRRDNRSTLTESALAFSERPLATWFVYQFFWPHSIRHYLHGPRCACRSCCLQTRRGLSNDCDCCSWQNCSSTAIAWDLWFGA